jgi:hypothetical protein
MLCINCLRSAGTITKTNVPNDIIAYNGKRGFPEKKI